MNDLDFPRARAVIERVLSGGASPGCQIHVWRNGEILINEGFGEAAPGRAMTADSIVLWLSSTKPVTAIAILQLWESGQLQLNDPVGKRIPEFAQHGKDGITIEHLLTHTAGFRSADLIDEKLDWDQTLAAICAAPLEEDFVPGTQAAYQLSSSWFVLGEIVQRITGRTLNDYVQDNICKPARIEQLWIGLPPNVRKQYADRIAWMHRTDKAPPQPHPFWNTDHGIERVKPGSNGRGRARDLAGLYRALLASLNSSSDAILKPDTARRMTSRIRKGRFDHTFRHTIDWGLGVIINSNIHGADTVPYGFGLHASDSTFGHGGAQSSCAFADPEHDLVVAWAFNGMPGEPRHQKRARELNTALYEDLKLTSRSATP